MTRSRAALNPVHAAAVDQFIPARVHRAAPCAGASLHLVAKVAHFTLLFFRRIVSLRYSFAASHGSSLHSPSSHQCLVTASAPC